VARRGQKIDDGSRRFAGVSYEWRRWLKYGQSDRAINFWVSDPKSAIVGFRILQKRQYNVGWVECNETQQSLE